MRFGLGGYGFIVFFLLGPSHSFANSRQLDCNKCKAVIFEGEITWTCPAASHGADYCIIDADGCYNVGVCP